jgi:tRNA G46 methylase TrmB
MIDFMQVFSSLTSSSSTGGNDRPLNIELGAGSGDWIVSQAQHNKLEDYVSVELRADRVAQTFAKCMMNMSKDEMIKPLENVCCVGAECGSFLRDRTIDGSVSSIYVNHPEPPTQTYGSDDKDLEVILESDGEPAHMLNSTTILAAAKCLKQDGKGKLIVVTDNRWYATLICVTLQKAMNEHTNILQQLPLERCNGMYQVQSFDTNNSGRLILYEGQPCSDIGHCVPTSLNDSGTSYFDRLWRTGAGRHAEMKKRFIIAVQTFDSSQPTTRDHIHFSKGGKQSHSFSSAPSVQRESKASASTTQSNKKISAKQQRRNERRLLAKQLKSAKK